MAADTKIEWAHHTFNAWIGCTKVSPGCDHCYAERQDAHRRWTPEGWGGPRRRTGAEYWKQPLKWDRAAARRGERQRVFCSSLADVFDNQVPAEWRADLWQLIAATPHLDWLLLTKRPMNIRKMLPADWGGGYPNVWLGTTVENQAEAERRIPHLVEIPARVHFLSCEPLLGPVDLTAIDINGEGEMNALTPDRWEDQWANWKGTTDSPAEDVEAFCEWYSCPEFPPDSPPVGPLHARIDWVICGGESGPNARPMHPGWARKLRDQCAAAGVAFHFKQWGEFVPCISEDFDGAVTCHPNGADTPRFDESRSAPLITIGEDEFWRIGKKAAGRLLDGVQHDDVPTSAQPIITGEAGFNNETVA